jgi:microcystin-dependent protein
MAKTRRKYKGNATTTTIGAGLAAGATSATLAANTGWPTTAPFYCVVSPGTSSEEKILIGAISGTSISSITRGVDDTSDQTHASGCTIYPVFTAIDADEANELTSTYSAQGHIVYQGASTFTGLAIGTAGQVLKVNSGATAPEWGQVPTAGIADDAVTAAKIATDAVGSAEIAANAVTATEIASDAVTTAKILDSNVTLAKLATAVQNALVPVGTIAMYGGAAAPTGWLLCDGSSINGSYTSLIAIVGANTPDLKGRFALGDNSTLTLLGTGGSTTIGTNNLPAHSHANTASASTSVSITDPGHTHGSGNTGTTDLTHSHELEGRTINNTSHTHTGTQSFATGSTGSSVVSPAPTTENALGTHSHTIGSASTGITASATTTVTMTNADTGGAEAYYQPYVVVNYIIKHD